MTDLNNKIAKLEKLDAERTQGDWAFSETQWKYLVKDLNGLPVVGFILKEGAKNYPREKANTQFIAAAPEMMAVIRELVKQRDMACEGLRFYDRGFEMYKQHKNLPGFAWRPTEALLDDCGETAKQTLAQIDDWK